MADAQREEIAKLEALYAAHPEGRVFTHLAEAYRRAGELGRAREILEDGLRRHPDYSSAHVVFGRVLMDLEETGAAASAFRRVLELDRHNLVALRSLGDLAERSGERAAAIGYYRDLIALDPTDDRLRLTVARLEEELAAGKQPEVVEAAPEPVEPAQIEGAVETTVPDTPGEPTAGEPVEAPWTGAEAPAGEAFAEEATAEEPSVLETRAEDEAGELAALDLPDLSLMPDAGEEELPAAPLPLLEGGEEEPFEFEGSPLEVQGLELGWDASDAPADAQPPEGFLTEEPAVDDALEAPALLPDELADIGWTAGDAADTRPDEEARTEAETEPVGDEALALDDSSWSSLGDRAESSWGAGPVETGVPEAEPAELIEEIPTWGPEPTISEYDESEPTREDEPGIAAEPEAPAARGSMFPPAALFGASREAGGKGAEGEVVTATMAELYAQQGFYDRAVDVYRQLVEQVPDDARLRERLAEIELLHRTAQAQVEETEAEAASVWTQPGDVAGGEETPYAWADSGAGEDGPGSGTTAGEYFRGLLGWRPAGRPEAGQPAVTDAEAAETGEPELETGAVAAAFEEWFGGERDAGGGEAEGEAQDEEDADLAMFRSWLQSLRK